MLERVRIVLPEAGALDPAALFPTPPREVWLEIGFGSGEHMAELAAAHPDVGFIGCEPFVNGVSAALGEIARRGLANVRILDDDARLLLERLPDGALERVYLLFPDPWPKKRHHRRRFLDAANLRLIARLLRPGGLLQVATDHMECGRWMLANALREPALEWLAERAADWKARPAGEPATRYEGKALGRGSPCHYFRFRRRQVA
ncbi:MAG: tRNA (guanosine(46)-N7)-methyltransferase TrmB [Alphaproteobacteria bacterium]|nr:tRNA (guanosine(46)-N7)-methyltransferase TrmB [Alphaproteobacteria bacterium]